MKSLLMLSLAACCVWGAEEVTTPEEEGEQVERWSDDGAELRVAAAEGRVGEMRRLLESGAKTESKDDDGWTALCEAAFNGETEAIKVLLEAGADVRVRDNEGWTPLLIAAHEG